MSVVEGTFITGATGFVGRNLLLRLLKRGEPVVAAVRDEKKLKSQLQEDGNAEWPELLTVISADPEQWPELPVQRALLSAGVLFARSREAYWQTNVDWTLQVIRRLPRACRMVLLSSQSAGGPTPLGQLTRAESDPDAPITWYGQSKQALEQAVRQEFSDRPIVMLRPPMILGPRDSATLPLFRMARGMMRIKPGLQAKTYSYVDVADLVEAVQAVWASDFLPQQSLYIAAEQTITDHELIGMAAQVSGRRGLTVPVPQSFVRVIASVVDAVPALREKTPSLTRDRAQEIWPNRWVVNGSQFGTMFNYWPRRSLQQALAEAYTWYCRSGLL